MCIRDSHKNAPSDLREKSLRLAVRILEFDPDVRGGQGYNIARDILESGRAFEKMQAVILAQGAQPKKQSKAPLEYAMLASKSGYISAINNLNIAHIASLAGAPIEKNAGVDLIKKVADKVKKGDTLFIIYASFKSDFEFSTQFAHENNAYVIAKNPPSTDDNYFI